MLAGWREICWIRSASALQRSNALKAAISGISKLLLCSSMFNGAERKPRREWRPICMVAFFLPVLFVGARKILSSAKSSASWGKTGVITVADFCPAWKRSMSWNFRCIELRHDFWLCKSSNGIACGKVCFFFKSNSRRRCLYFLISRDFTARVSCFSRHNQLPEEFRFRLDPAGASFLHPLQG